LNDVVNFVKLKPVVLSEGWFEVPDSHSIRRERSPFNMQDPDVRVQWSAWCGMHNSSYKFLLRHNSGKIVRCKQFLYDIGPLSASDHGALYDYYPWRLGHRISGDRVYWHGYDYVAKQAVSFQDSGTNVELRVVDGELPVDDLIELAESFKPAVSNDTSSCFAEKTYWSRYGRYDLNLYLPDSPYKLPSSMWKLRWPLWQEDHCWQIFDENMIAADLINILHILSSYGFEPESTCTFGAGNPLEVQLFLRHREHRNGQGWLRRIQADRCPLVQPNPDQLPNLDAFSGFSGFGISVVESHSLETPVYIASVTETVGPYDLIWWDRGYLYLVQICTSPYMKLETIKTLAEEIASPRA
jgi:hypothetical protein